MDLMETCLRGHVNLSYATREGDEALLSVSSSVFTKQHPNNVYS